MSDIIWQMSSAGLRMFRSGPLLKFEPFESMGDEQVLDVDLERKSVSMGRQKSNSSQFTIIPGILGIFSFSQGLAVVTVTACKKVASYHGHPVYKIISTQILLPENKITSSQDLEYFKLLRKAVDTREAATGLYYCYGTNLTLHTERLLISRSRQADLTNNAYTDLEDNRFFWNRYLSSPLLEAKAFKYVLPVIQGFVSETAEIEISKNCEIHKAELTILARRSIERIGTRYWRRGVDRQGAVSNFVETEQLIYIPNDQSICSFVQLRGSVPIFWSQAPNIKYKPPTIMPQQEMHSAAFDRHISNLLEAYKECVALNLVNQHGSEGRLCKYFQKETERFLQIKEGFKLVSFDFHKECGTKNYHRLSVLLSQIKADLDKFGYFSTVEGKLERRQGGVFRTNCVDCLDRTNVVQGVLARAVLEDFLTKKGYLKKNIKIDTTYPSLEKLFKAVWADHGDELSNQYAGTGAMKSGFTRTGKRTLGGLVDDGIKACVRYYLNNFQDGTKQDALDLVTGALLQNGRGHGFIGAQRSPAIAIVLAFTFLLLLTSQIMNIEDVNFGICIMSAIAFVAVIALVVANGKYLVCKPRLRPDLIKQW